MNAIENVVQLLEKILEISSTTGVLVDPVYNVKADSKDC